MNAWAVGLAVAALRLLGDAAMAAGYVPAHEKGIRPAELAGGTGRFCSSPGSSR